MYSVHCVGMHYVSLWRPASTGVLKYTTPDVVCESVSSDAVSTNVTGRDKNNADNAIQIFILGGHRRKCSTALWHRRSPDDSTHSYSAPSLHNIILSFPGLSVYLRNCGNGAGKLLSGYLLPTILKLNFYLQIQMNGRIIKTVKSIGNT